MFTIKKLGTTLKPTEKSLHGVNLDSEDVPEQFKCPICFEVPEKEIYQCTHGHTICSKCQTSLDRCPQCRVPFAADSRGIHIRNRALESLLDSLVISCPYLAKGCEETVHRSEFKKHVAMCVYNGKCIQLCQHLRLNCDFWTKTLRPKNAAWHLRGSHNATLQNSNKVILEFKHFSDIFDNLRGSLLPQDESQDYFESDVRLYDGIWAPVLLTAFNANFVILSLLNHKDRTMTWTSFYLDYFEEPKEFEVEFKIQANSESASDLKWKIPVVPVLKVATILLIPPIRVSFDHLQNYYLRPDYSLQIEVSVIEPGNPPQTGNQLASVPEVVYEANTMGVRIPVPE